MYFYAFLANTVDVYVLAGTVLVVTQHPIMMPLVTRSSGRGRWEDSVAHRFARAFPRFCIAFHLVHSRFRVLVDLGVLLSAIRMMMERGIGRCMMSDLLG